MSAPPPALHAPTPSLLFQDNDRYKHSKDLQALPASALSLLLAHTFVESHLPASLPHIKHEWQLAAWEPPQSAARAWPVNHSMGLKWYGGRGWGHALLTGV